MLQAEYFKQIFEFKTPGGTSRGVLKTKESWIISLYDSTQPAKIGFGECSIIRGLSRDKMSRFEIQLREVCHSPEDYSSGLNVKLDDFPAIRFGFEQALIDLKTGGIKQLYPSSFTDGTKSISINGLVWMGQPSFMRKQIDSLLEKGFECIKMKVGAIDFDTELDLLKYIRSISSDVELRVDANGAFTEENVWKRLEALAKLDIRSIEQPIATGQLPLMRELSQKGAIPIALDEELIACRSIDDKKRLLETIEPPYIVLKPSLLGGFEASDEFIQTAVELGIDWWVTSALEGNVGLNAIAQWTAQLNHDRTHGLGTGSLFTNNFACPLNISRGQLWNDPTLSWARIAES